MRVDVEVGSVAVKSLTHAIGQFADFLQGYARIVQDQAIIQRQAYASRYFLANMFKRTNQFGWDHCVAQFRII
jgi:hypothetical protein